MIDQKVQPAFAAFQEKARSEGRYNDLTRIEVFLAGWEAALESIKPPEDKIPYATIINRMNTILAKRFKVSEVNKKFIRARWSEGFREPDFEKVCQVKLKQWGKDPDMCPYLRPETLFGTKMDAYNNEPLTLTDIPDYL